MLPSLPMGPLGHAVLIALLRLPIWHEDREEMERDARIAVIAQAIESATLRATCGDRWPELGCRKSWPGSPETLAALLAMKAWKEAALARRWHMGDCRGSECDHGTSQSLWQLKPVRWMTEHPWSEITGTDLVSTTYAAWYAARALSCGYRACGDLPGAISMYATGSQCWWPGATDRVRLAVTLEIRIRREMRAAR